MRARQIREASARNSSKRLTTRRTDDEGERETTLGKSAVLSVINTRWNILPAKYFRNRKFIFLENEMCHPEARRRMKNDVIVPNHVTPCGKRQAVMVGDVMGRCEATTKRSGA